MSAVAMSTLAMSTVQATGDRPGMRSDRESMR